VRNVLGLGFQSWRDSALNSANFFLTTGEIMAEKTKNSKSAFSEQERELMRERAKEAREFKKLSGEQQVQAKLAEMDKEDQKLALEVHKLVLSISPDLKPRSWYGMPAYYLGDKVICFFQSASKFKVRYSTFGFQEAAKLDDGSMWATSFALTKFDDDVAKKISKLVKKAIS
jgi:uncharacterized protein YdhG (YjbR/CyaY superfamily)